MIGAIILTFVITVLAMLVLFFVENNRKQLAERNRLIRENCDLRRQMSDYSTMNQRRRERSAYDRGLYDGRATDTLYRSVLKRYSAKEQVDVMMDGETAAKAENTP